MWGEFKESIPAALRPWLAPAALLALLGLVWTVGVGHGENRAEINATNRSLEALHDAVETLRETVGDQSRTVERVSGTVENLSGSVERVNDAVETLRETVSDQSRTVGRLSVVAETLGNSVESIDSTVDALDENGSAPGVLHDRSQQDPGTRRGLQRDSRGCRPGNGGTAIAGPSRELRTSTEPRPSMTVAGRLGCKYPP